MNSTVQESSLALLGLYDKYFASQGKRFGFNSPGVGTAEAWFLGPKAENTEVLKALVLEAIDKHAEYRRAYQPQDPEFITAAVKKTPAYQDGIDRLRSCANELFDQLQLSVPLSSMRYQAHMLWDQVLPAVVGYFAAMLYNQNNVASEASPLTTKLEILVGNDLCRMLGFTDHPWGHITCDGTVANIEALWAARNVKFFPIALREALREEPALRAARGLTVRLLDETEAPLIDLDPWVLLNLKIDDVVRLQNDIVEQFSISVEVTTDALSSYAIQHIGLLDFYRKFMPSISESPVVMVPSTRHYSWPKAATILGLGQNNVLRVGVDCQARMDIDALMPLLEECLERRTPVLSVVAVIGSTEESAVDPLCRILAVRDDFRKRGLDFAIHCDAAWGGYFSSMLRNDLNGRLIDAVPVYPMSDYVIQQYDALRNADSITVDPHKAGYVPYPAGGLCYRNSALRDQVSLAAPIVFHSQLEPTVGIYGIEGSKPGAAAAAVYLAHQVIRPSQSGYGKILGNCMWTSKRMYARLITMGDQRITITFLQQLPAELANEKPAVIEAQKAYIGENFVNCTNEQLWHLLEDPRASKLFKDIGSDQVILSYAFNFFDGDGNLNTDLTKANMLNDSVFNVCSVTKPPTSMADLNKLKVIVTESSFDPAIYGQPFVDRFARRMGVATSPGVPVKFLISTTMDPWTTEAPPTPENQSGDFQAVIADALMSAAHQALHSLKFGPDRASETSQ